MKWSRVVITHNDTKLYGYCICGDRLYYYDGHEFGIMPKDKMFPAICRRHTVCSTPLIQRSEASFHDKNVHWLWEYARGYNPRMKN